MDRLQVIRELQSGKKLKNYLEIGVFNGHNFFKVKATFKIAIDPAFRFDFLRRAGKTILNPYNIFNQYFEKTSDDFFAQDAPGIFANKHIDLSLIDGMHEYLYALRDVENTLKYMGDDAVIIVHDCNPLTKEDAVSYEKWKDRQFTGVWNGDVWKAIVNLRSFRSDVNVFVLDCDNGLGIVTKRKNEDRLPFTLQDIDNFTYEDFDKNRKEWLNLKAPEYFYEYFGLK